MVSKVRPFDPNAVYVDDGNVGYLSACLKAGTWAVSKIMNSDEAKAVHGLDEIPVHPEAPQQGQHYPYIQIGYTNTAFTPTTLNSAYVATLAGGTTAHVASYKYSGLIEIGIYTIRIAERERLSDCLLAQVGIRPAFRQAIIQNQWIDMSPNMATLASPVANESFGTPWDKDLPTAYRHFNFKVQGEFYYKVSETPEYLTKIQVQGKIS